MNQKEIGHEEVQWINMAKDGVNCEQSNQHLGTIKGEEFYKRSSKEMHILLLLMHHHTNHELDTA
jgi:hypothetical protein